jgi:beta-mannosidase
MNEKQGSDIMIFNTLSIKPTGVLAGLTALLSVITVLFVQCAAMSAREDAASPSELGLTFGLEEGWQFRRVGENEWFDASVPGCVHTDLLANGLIDDPFFGDNERNLQWIELEDWEYRTGFDLPADILGHDRVDLVFEGLDTYASVYLNDSLVLDADNMFRAWRIDCSGIMRERENELRVIFRSAVRAVRDEWRSLPCELPGGPRVLARKAAYQYGWDWAPRFATCGIWRPVRLEAWSGARIDDIRIIQKRLSTMSADLEAVVEIESLRESNVSIALIDGNGIERGDGTLTSVRGKLNPGMNSVRLGFTIGEPRLWWPQGRGEQYLYDLIVELSADTGIVDVAYERTGIREVRLVTEPAGAGESFRFEVNGAPLFVKGANWVPLDAFPGGIEQERYEAMIQNAVRANMNMLRVWGGGIYEDDLFYDLCDEQGILVWQDFMFACAMFPGNDAFLENVRAEAEGVVKRLRGHPSVVLWCGNNESEEGWRNWGWQRQYGYTPEDSARIRGDYEKLFHELLPRIVDELDGSRAYIPSSPRYGRADPKSLTEGDSHYWGVWHDGEPFELYEERVGRFMSEYGFQSFPSIGTIDGFTAPGDRRLDSDVMRAHQKHPRGNELIRTYMERAYHVPEDFESFVYVSQLLQAEGVGRAIEAHRRAAPRCMGSLYWQLNDCWPAASWSSVDYNGRWKALHYRVRRAFAPELVSVSQAGDTIDVHIVSDGVFPAGWELMLSLVDFRGEVVWEERWPVRVDLCRETPYRRILSADIMDGGIADRVVFSAELRDVEGFVRSRALHYFVEPKLLPLERPRVEVTAEYAGAGSRTLLVTTDVLAKGVFLYLDGADALFSDNFFDILPGDTLLIDLSAEASDLRNLDGRLVVRTLHDTFP